MDAPILSEQILARKLLLSVGAKRVRVFAPPESDLLAREYDCHTYSPALKIPVRGNRWKGWRLWGERESSRGVTVI